MIYISSYISFAPILNYNYRQKLKSFLLQNINIALEDIHKLDKKEEIKDINFPELMYNFLDITGKDKELFMNSGIYNDFLKENFIFLHIAQDRVPFILDYTQSANEIIREYLSRKCFKIGK